MPRFTYVSIIDAPLERVWAFHERPDAIELLTPPSTPLEVVSRSGGLEAGARIVFRVGRWPLRITWVAEHTDYERGRWFTDVQKEGPFRSWVHRHEFQNESGKTRLTDSIEFHLPGGELGDALAGWAVRLQLRAMFRHRHEVTRKHCVIQ
jgi:ligand-binding SRPBCC domain-containing protein